MSSDKEFELPVFLKEESELFTLLGVFGAISLYLAQFPVDIQSRWLNIGIVSSLLIFITVALSIRAQIKSRLDSNLFDFIIKPRPESFQVLTFIVPFYLLLVSILVVVIQFQSAGRFVLQLMLMFVGISTVLYARATGEKLIGYDNLGAVGRDQKVVHFAMFLLVIAIVGLIGSGLGVLHLREQFDYGIADLGAVRQGSGVVPFLVSYLAGVLAGSVLYLIVSVMLLSLHRLISRVDQMENREAFKRGMRVLFGNDPTEGQTELGDFEKE